MVDLGGDDDVSLIDDDSLFFAIDSRYLRTLEDFRLW